MFYRKTLSRTVLLHPKFFKGNLKKRLKANLVEDVSGSCLGTDGYVVAVLDVQDEDVSRGKLQTATGQAVFHIKFQAILLRPYVNEVVQAEVILCNRHGLFARVGPMEIFVSQHLMGESFKSGWDPETQRWTEKFAEDDSPMTIHGRDGDANGTPILLRIVSCDLREGKWTIIGRINEIYLGELPDSDI